MKTFIIKSDWMVDEYFDRGYGNGYAAIPEGHSMFEKDYNDIPVHIHGGLTFATSSKECTSDHFKKEIKNLGDGNYWIGGFDTAHHGDNCINCDKDYVEKEIVSLVDQLNKL